MSHTPTPWKFGVLLHDSAIAGPNEEDIATINGNNGCDDPEFFPHAANARFIVRAVNAFEPMREALKNTLAVCESLDIYDKYYPVLDEARAALALADKEKP